VVGRQVLEEAGAVLFLRKVHLDTPVVHADIEYRGRSNC
jgi:hypothetical protein